ncbi:MAG: hypothetical protein KAV87_68220 [Desulfobacteraceae bacterium]|nr:hypothetical protein [Desulfobacteraceae bacterium]
MFDLIKMGVGFLFGGSAKESQGVSNAMEVARGVGNFIDEQQYTPEEKAVANAQVMTNVLEAVKATRSENSTRSVTRRVLAWMIMGSLVMAFWLGVFIRYVLKGDPQPLIDLVNAFMVGELAVAVGAFYFMVSIVRSRK